MMTIIFANLEQSELAREAVLERITPVIQKFPDAKGSRLRVTLAMENSPVHAGPDLFAVNLHFRGGRYHDVRLRKRAANLYHALAEIAELLPDTLNRFGDRVRVKERRWARSRFSKKAPPAPSTAGSENDDEFEFEYYDRP